jgi:hypothetical protein
MSQPQSSRSTLSLGESQAPGWVSRARNTGGSRRPEENDTERGECQGCNSLNDSAAGASPTAGGSTRSTVGIPQGGDAQHLPYPPYGVGGRLGEMLTTGAIMTTETKLREALKEIRDRIAEHPEYQELTEKEEMEIGGDTAEFSYLVRLADEALAAKP